MNKFSVVIPLYNKEKSILRSLKSIDKQTMVPSEVIVVDDGSSDGGVKKLEQFYSDRFNLKIISQNNSGVSVARNKGIENSENDIVLMMDADDFWSPFHCENIIRSIESEPEVGFFFAAHTKCERDVDSGRPLKPSFICFEVGDLIKEYRKNRNLIHTSAVGFRKSILKEDLKFKPGARRSQDILLWLSIGAKYRAIYSKQITSVKTSDFEQAGARSSVIPAHLEHYLIDGNEIPELLKRDFEYILGRSAVLEYWSSARNGKDMSRDFSSMFKGKIHRFYYLFRMLAFSKAYKLLGKL